MTPSDSKQPKLELRHQRTGDVVFDWIDTADKYKTPQYYVYKMIEILLPKAINKAPLEELQSKNMDKARNFKLIELWAPDATPRKGWLKVC